MCIRVIAAACLVSLLSLASPALAQQRHVVKASDMRQAIAAQVHADQQTREALRGVLKNSQVRATAERLGLNVAGAEGAIATLTPAELERLAGPVTEVNAQLAGGANTVVISTTTILLIIIIILLLN